MVDNYSMIKMFTAFTTEIDDSQQAAAEILEQLKPQEHQLKNTIALVFFHYEFAINDNLQKFLKALPFELAGCMSTYMGTNGQHGDVAITVTMFTSDDVTFKVKTIENVKDKNIQQMREEVTATCKDFCKDETPKLIIPFLSASPLFCGNDLMNAVNKYNKKLMLFGMHVFNIDGVPDTSFVLADGKLSSDMCAMIAFYGNVNPKFRINTSIAFSESFGETAEITDAELSTLKTVNGIPALDFLKKKGLITPDNIHNTASLMAVPAILTYKNGTKVSCAFTGIDEQKGYAITARTLEKGAKIVLSQLDGKKTFESARSMVREIKEVKENDFLAFSCAARVWSIGSNLFSEMQVIEEGAKEYENEYGVPLNYNIAYSGGEICPIPNGDGVFMNMVHNYTLVVCTFN